MLGAVIGDIAGSTYEFNPFQGKWEEIPLFTLKSEFTDDTVMTFAVAEALAQESENIEAFKENLVDLMHSYGQLYPNAGYGGRFSSWLGLRQREPYNSYGNGSAMRVSPVAWAFNNLEDVEKFAGASASVTHNHPEGIKGACSVAGAIYLARTGHGKQEIKDYVTGRYGYDLDRTLVQIRESYGFDETCQGSVPESILAFLESDNFEQSIRKAIWLRGDADTQAAIAGSIAEAFWPIPEEIRQEALSHLDDKLFYSYQRLHDFFRHCQG